MSSTRGRVKRVAQRTREWVSKTVPTLDSDSDIPSLASSDEEDSDIEIERKNSLDKPSASSREKSPEYGTGGLVDNETINPKQSILIRKINRASLLRRMYWKRMRKTRRRMMMIQISFQSVAKVVFLDSNNKTSRRKLRNVK